MKLSLKFKRFIFGLLAVFLSGYAAAQTVLLPNLRGTFSEHQSDISFFGMLRLGQSTGLTATASGTLANSQVLSIGYNHFSTVASGNDSATLPTLTGSVMVVVSNGAASNSMKVWPDAAASQINNGGAGVGFTIAAGKTAIFIQAASGVWFAILSA